MTPGPSTPEERHPPDAADEPGGSTDDRDDEVIEAEVVEVGDDAAGGSAAHRASAGAGPPPAAASDADGTVTDDEGLDAAADAVQVDLDLLLAEREEYLDAYRRTQADFENYRRQTRKRQEDAVAQGLGSFVEGLLPVLDACDAAVAHGERDAVEPVVAALHRALEKEGLERIDPAGEPFDPEQAEAVMHEPGDGGQQMVSEVMRAGYRWRGRVLRPAMVKVTD